MSNNTKDYDEVDGGMDNLVDANDVLYTLKELSEETGLNEECIRRNLKKKGYAPIEKRGREHLYNAYARMTLCTHKPRPKKPKKITEDPCFAEGSTHGTKDTPDPCFANMEELRNRITDMAKTLEDLKVWKSQASKIIKKLAGV